MINCIFVVEAAFHINMKRTFVWYKVASSAVAYALETRARATAILRDYKCLLMVL